MIQTQQKQKENTLNQSPDRRCNHSAERNDQSGEIHFIEYMRIKDEGVHRTIQAISKKVPDDIPR